MEGFPQQPGREEFPAHSSDASRGRVAQLVKSLAHIGTRFEGRYFWHETRDPYVLFLAEFFLRRSNRTTVERYLPEFLNRFPDPSSLAAAKPDEIVTAAAWAGLRKRTGRLPYIISRFMERDHWTAVELRTLPHIGAYAAEGIALYVFDEPAFPIDNNVRRVVGRSLGLADESSLQEAVESIVMDCLTEGNQRLLRHVHMGALALGWNHCRSVPRCSGCPLFDMCDSRARSFEEDMVS